MLFSGIKSSPVIFMFHRKGFCVMVTYYKVKAMLLRTLCLACGLCSVFSLGSLPEDGLSALTCFLARGGRTRWAYRAGRRAERTASRVRRTRLRRQAYARQAAASPRLHTSPAAPRLMRTA